MKKILFIISILLIVSCSKTQFPEKDIRVEYKYIHTTDTIINNSTTYIKEKGDTIYIKETKEIYKYRNKTDTCIVKDTVNLTVYKDKIEYVEVNKLKNWQIILMVLGGILLGIIGYKLLRIIKI